MVNFNTERRTFTIISRSNSEEDGLVLYAYDPEVVSVACKLIVLHVHVVHVCTVYRVLNVRFFRLRIVS